MSSGKTTTPRDSVALGVAAIVVAVLGLSLGDALIKATSQDFPVWQLYVVRSLFALPILAAIVAFRRRPIALRPRSWFWTTVRSLLLASMWVFYYVALPELQLPLAAAAYYTAPLFIVLLAAPLAGDRVGLTGWLAVAVGFAGMLLMLRPDASGFNLFALLPVVAAVLYALAMILTRTKCRDEEPMTLSIALNVAFVVVGALASLGILAFGLGDSLGTSNPFLFGSWAPLETDLLLVFAALAIAIILGSVGAAIAYQAAPPSIVATFDYAYLAFATLWGLLFFSEIPDGWAVLGMIMIAGAGLLAIRR